MAWIHIKVWLVNIEYLIMWCCNLLAVSKLWDSLLTGTPCICGVSSSLWSASQFSSNGFTATEENTKEVARCSQSAIHSSRFPWRWQFSWCKFLNFGLLVKCQCFMQKGDFHLIISHIYYLLQMEMPAGLGFSNAEYYPYVYYKVNLDMISSAGSLL